MIIKTSAADGHSEGFEEQGKSGGVRKKEEKEEDNKKVVGQVLWVKVTIWSGNQWKWPSGLELSESDNLV